MTESMKDNTKELEQQVLQILKGELDAISDHFHDLIPAQLLPEDKLGWILKAKKAGLFTGGMNQYYTNQAGNNVEKVLSLLSKSFDSREVKLQKLVDYVLDTELQNLPDHIQELIPISLTVEEKLAWIRKVKDKGVMQNSMYKAPSMPQNKGLGTGPFTGPGTAPGTGPGTAPWLENQNTDMYKNMPSETPMNVKEVIDEDDDESLEEVEEQFYSELSLLNEVLIFEGKKLRGNESDFENTDAAVENESDFENTDAAVENESDFENFDAAAENESDFENFDAAAENESDFENIDAAVENEIIAENEER
jgi:enoyl-CoA hydratase/carnithine racemase